MKKKYIQKSQYEELLRLKKESDENYKELEELEKRALKITKEKGEINGFTFDFIYGNNNDIDYLLERLNISIKKNE